MGKNWAWLISLLTLGFISAQGLGELLDLVNESTLILSVVFLVSFAFLFFAMKKFFKQDNQTLAGVVSAALAILITYGFNKTEIDLSNFFLDIGISRETLMTIIPIVILAAVVLVAILLKKKSLLVFGGLLLFLGFFLSEGLILIIIGIILLVIGLALSLKKDKKKGFRIVSD